VCLKYFAEGDTTLSQSAACRLAGCSKPAAQLSKRLYPRRQAVCDVHQSCPVRQTGAECRPIAQFCDGLRYDATL